jgi:Bestrophin, RFP-TM, chloride channel
MVQLYQREVGGDRAKRIVNLVAAFPYLLRHHIRPGCLCGDASVANDVKNRLLLREPMTEMMETRQEGEKSFRTTVASQCWVDKRNLPWSLLESSALKHAANAQNRPLWVCDRMSRQIMGIPYGPNFTSRERLSLLGQVEKLTDSIGQCERIHQTAVPLNYARHSLRSLAIWLITLPFALVKDLGLLTGPCMAVMAWLLFGVYQIGYSIEDPFQGTLRLSVLCDAIRRDVLGERQSAFTMDWNEDIIEVPDALMPQPETMMLHSLITPAMLQRNGTWGVVGLSTP